MVSFGWSYPAGVTDNDIDDNFGEPDQEEIRIVVLVRAPLPREINEMFVGLSFDNVENYTVWSAFLLEPMGDKAFTVLDRLYKNHEIIHWTHVDQRGRLTYAHQYNR